MAQGALCRGSRRARRSRLPCFPRGRRVSNGSVTGPQSSLRRPAQPRPETAHARGRGRHRCAWRAVAAWRDRGPASTPSSRARAGQARCPRRAAGSPAPSARRAGRCPQVSPRPQPVPPGPIVAASCAAARSESVRKTAVGPPCSTTQSQRLITSLTSGALDGPIPKMQPLDYVGRTIETHPLSLR